MDEGGEIVPENSSVRLVLRQLISRLDPNAHEAQWLLQTVTGITRATTFSDPDFRLSAEQVSQLHAMVDRRLLGEPLAYITGHIAFHNIELCVSPAVLIPRADSECLVNAALTYLPDHVNARVLDLGTGSGALALAIAYARPKVTVLALERSEPALQVALANVAASGLTNVRCRESDWFSALGGDEKFDLIVSNPPYLAQDDPHLGEGDLPFEPRMALVSGPTGLEDLQTIIATAPVYLRSNGYLLLEHGHQQGLAVRELLTQAGFATAQTRRDLAGRERVGIGQFAGKAVS
jgi:release factor glutamine methyltransferase